VLFDLIRETHVVRAYSCWDYGVQECARDVYCLADEVLYCIGVPTDGVVEEPPVFCSDVSADLLPWIVGLTLDAERTISGHAAPDSVMYEMVAAAARGVREAARRIIYGHLSRSHWGADLVRRHLDFVGCKARERTVLDFARAIAIYISSDNIVLALQLPRDGSTLEPPPSVAEPEDLFNWQAELATSLAKQIVRPADMPLLARLRVAQKVRGLREVAYRVLCAAESAQLGAFLDWRSGRPAASRQRSEAVCLFGDQCQTCRFGDRCRYGDACQYCHVCERKTRPNREIRRCKRLGISKKALHQLESMGLA